MENTTKLPHEGLPRLDTDAKLRLWVTPDFSDFDLATAAAAPNFVGSDPSSLA